MTQFAPSGDDPLAAFTAELQQIRAKAEEAQERLSAASATVQAPDGAATVTVGPSGMLLNLSFGNRAYQRPPEALAALVMQLIGTAQKQASAEVAGAFAGLVGENSAAMDVLQEFLPQDEDPDEPDDEPEDEPPATPPPPPPPSPPQQQQPPPRRPPARPRPDEDDEDFSNPW